LIEEYELDGVGVELETRWTRQDDRWSLRDLADWFNQQLLKKAIADAGVQPVDGEVANNYRLLADDAVSEGDRVQLRRRLEQAGIDVDTLLDDFVTYQAIRTYLKDVRDATYDYESETRTESVREQVDRLVGRTETVVDGQLTQLERKGELTIGDFRVLVDVRAYCEGCNTQYEIATLLKDGGCDCMEEG
jgi:hypothetical protein